MFWISFFGVILISQGALAKKAGGNKEALEKPVE